MSELVKLANFRTKTEAEAAAVLLKNKGVPYLIQSAEGMGYGPINPGATIYVTADAADYAREVLGMELEDDEDYEF